MSLFLLVLTHTGCVVATFLLTRWFTLRTARTWPQPPTPHPLGALEARMHHDPSDNTQARKVREWGRTATVLVGAGLFIILIGVQAYLSQRDQNREDAQQKAEDARQQEQVECLDEWGKALVETVTTRTASNAKLERAENRLTDAEAVRDAAIDTIFITVIRFREIPPAATEDDFTRSLRIYQKALEERDEVQADLAAVQDEVDGVRTDNPYPDLLCGVTDEGVTGNSGTE